jgi:dienelactone hydrolase
MRQTMRWNGEAQVDKGVTERGFVLDVDGHEVPGLLWTPADADGTRPLVLLGHGGGTHKRTPYILAMARKFVRHHGFAAVAIDAVGHGARAPEGELDQDERRRRFYQDDAFATMVGDWQATIAAVQALPDVGEGPLAWWGLSMGTIFGVPVVAAEPRIQVATLGLMGIRRGGEEWQRITGERLAADAGRIQCPVLFLFQWDDELVTREAGMELFDAIGTPDKRMHVNPGRHAAVPPFEMDFSERFIAERLGTG